LAALLKDLEKRKMDDFYIEKILKGDHNSFRYFIKTYNRFAFSLSYAILKDKHLTEDAVQDSFVKAFHGLKSFRRNSTFQTWLGKIVINESLRKAKSRAIEYVRYDEISDHEIEVVNDSINSLIIEEQKFYISAVFEQLSANESLALDLFYLKDNTIEDITEITGWSVSKTKMVLLRGRKNFYSQLKKTLRTEIKEII
jgi:RNA polymerase sigma-70 factor, ECF subfamily